MRELDARNEFEKWHSDGSGKIPAHAFEMRNGHYKYSAAQQAWTAWWAAWQAALNCPAPAIEPADEVLGKPENAYAYAVEDTTHGAMLFFDKVEAYSYCAADEEPIALYTEESFAIKRENIRALADRIESYVPRGDGCYSQFASDLLEAAGLLRGRASPEGK